MPGFREKAAANGRNRGATLVELAIVILLLFTLVFGMIELGLLARDNLALNQVAREAARSAAVGSDLATVNSRVTFWTEELGLRTADMGSPTVVYSDPDTGDPIEPDSATSGAEVAVTLTYQHRPVTALFPFLPETVGVTTTMVMRLEVGVSEGSNP